MDVQQKINSHKISVSIYSCWLVLREARITIML